MSEVNIVEKERFQETVIGEFPDDWKVFQLHNIIQKERKITYGIVQPGKYDPDGIFLVRGKDYSKGWAKPEDFFRVSAKVEKPYKRARLEPNDLLTTIVGAGVGNMAIVPTWLEGANITQTTARIAIDKSVGDFRFYYYVLSSSIGSKNVRLFEKGGAQPGLNLGDIEKYHIPFPPLPEQQKIAEILSTVDEKIEVIDEQIKQTQELKKGLMQRLLTKGIGHTKFKDSPVGEIPESWEVVKISKLGKVITGSTPSSNNEEYYCEKGILWATPADLGYGKYIKKTNKQLTKIGYAKTRQLPKNSILVTCIGSTIGKIGMAHIEMATNQQINALVCDRSNESDFYYYVLEGKASFIKKMAGTQAVPLLNKTDFSAISVVNPPLEEQRVIGNIFSQIDIKTESLQSKKQTYQELKKGLMQKLLTGKIRVKI